jgi:predicted dehydrogenase
VATFKSVDQLLNSGVQVDGGDICSPHGVHHVLGCQLLDGGVNVLCEKPIGITVKASKKIAATAKKRGLVAATAEQCRRAIGQRAIHWAFHDGDLLGTPRMWWAVKGGLAGSDQSRRLALAYRPQARRLRHGHGLGRPLGRHDALLVR